MTASPQDLATISPEIAEMVSELLQEVAGEPVAYMMLIMVEGKTLYLGNVPPEDGFAAAEEAKREWGDGQGEFFNGAKQ